MLEYITSSQFRRDFKRQKRSSRHTNVEKLFLELLSLLLLNKPLPQQYKEHKLIGKYVGCHECHLAPDLLVVYRFKTDHVELVRMGTHAEIF